MDKHHTFFMSILPNTFLESLSLFFDHAHEPIILPNTLFWSMVTQVMPYSTTGSMLCNTIGIMSMIRIWIGDKIIQTQILYA
jgi:hypothetical protein